MNKAESIDPIEKVINKAHKAIDSAFERGKKLGVEKLYLEIVKTDIDDVPFPSNVVLEARNKLLAEMGEKENE